MAPEILEWYIENKMNMDDNPDLKYDYSADSYSLGVLLYNMCTKSYPFMSDSGKGL